MKRQYECDFSYVYNFGEGNNERVTKCLECLPGGGYCTDYVQDTGYHCPEAGCEALPEEYYCPLNATFDGQHIWGVCEDSCLDGDKGTLRRKAITLKL